MRIAYCTNVRLPSERAHGHQVAAVVRALHALGHTVEVFAPSRRNVLGADFHTYYGLPSEIRIQYLGFFDPIAAWWLPGVLGLWCLNLVFRLLVPRAIGGRSFDCLYTRSPALLSALLRTGAPVILELHRLPRWRRRSFVRLCQRCRCVVPLTSAMAATLVSWGLDRSLLHVAGDAVDLTMYQHLPDRTAARRSLSVSTDRVVVGYVGRLRTLGMEKGVEMILRAVASDRRFFGLIVGGPAADRAEYERCAAALGLSTMDVLFTGEVPAADVPCAIAACDIAAMPFPDLPHYRFAMSPLKMFEYMAAGRPIVTSDLPTVRDVLSDTTAWFYVPDDLDSFLGALRAIADHPAEAALRVRAALQLVTEHTWERRMQRILSVMS